MTPTIVLVGADKGGVGKTTVARTLLDYLAHHEIASRVFDTEHPNGSLCRFHGAAVIDLTEVTEQMRVFDGVTEAGVTVVDLRAGLLSETVKALDDAMLLDDVRSGAIRLVLLHVLGPTVESISEIASIADRIGGGAKHFLVKNHINRTKYDNTALLAQMKDVTIEVPQLIEEASKTINENGGSFTAFATNPANSRILRGRVVLWLEAVWSEFDRVGIRQLVAPQPAVEAVNPLAGHTTS
jgi:hypothetical protein